MSKHTPGEWTVEDRVERLLIWADGSHDFIAQLSTIADGSDDDAQEAYEAEQHANAELIAAAPALLATLTALESKLDNVLRKRIAPPSDLAGIATLGALEDLCAKARLLIKKAGGAA